MLYLISLLVPFIWGIIFCVKDKCLFKYSDEDTIRYYFAISILVIISYLFMIIICCYNAIKYMLYGNKKNVNTTQSNENNLSSIVI